MPFEWFVALRYLREGRTQTALILAAVSIGVSVIVFLSALINGLQTSLIDRTLGSQPHVTLRPPEQAARPLSPPTPPGGVAIANLIEKSPQRIRGIDQWARAMEDASRLPGVLAVSPTVTSAAFALRGNARKPVLVRGIDRERFQGVIRVADHIQAGAFSVSGADAVIGVELASALGVWIGDTIRLNEPDGRTAILTVAGVFDLGNKEVNERWVLTSLRQAQTLFDLPGGVTTIELKIDDVFAADSTAEAAGDRTGLVADSWMKVNAQLLVALRSQGSSKSMIQFFVVLAVTLGIASVLIVSVVQKSREIGILRAVGTSAARVRRVFLIQGGVLGLAGSVVGSGLGVLFSLFFEGLARNADGSATFPVDLNPGLFAGATALAVSVGLIAAVLPARRAAALDPATAIRHG